MKISANLRDPSIVAATVVPAASEQESRFSFREATSALADAMRTATYPQGRGSASSTNPSTDEELDTPLKRLSNNAMSGSEAIGLLQKFWMLPQLQRELILDAELAEVICSQEEVFAAYKAFYQKYQINSDDDRTTWLERNNCTLEQFEHSILRTLKLDRFKQRAFGNKVESYFLQRKNQLDRAVYSLLRVKDAHLAQELFFRIQDKEATFTELVKQYSGGQEAENGGTIGPHELSIPHPILAQKLSSLKPGQLSPPVAIADWFVIVKLEKYLPAQLDKTLRSRLIDELYDRWLQEKISQL